MVVPLHRGGKVVERVVILEGDTPRDTKSSRKGGRVVLRGDGVDL